MPELTEGSIAPNFSLPSTIGETFVLEKERGKWVVLYFYPKDDTPGCTTEACNFRDRFEDYKKVGAVIYGVSTDELASHDKFIKKYSLPFPLLADTEKKVVELYGVWKEKNMYGKKFLGIERTTFIINPEGKIVKIFKRVKVENHHEEVLATIKENTK